MKRMKFEYRISVAYFVIGAAWILLSDRLVEFVAIHFQIKEMTLQTAKGWFYVFATALLLLLFIRKHLGRLRETEAELEKHQSKLTGLVNDKTKKLDTAINELRQINETLTERNEFIDNQNKELVQAINDLRSTQVQLAQADRMAAIGVLTSGIAHEVNAPLKAIEKSMLELSKSMQGKLAETEEYASHSQHIKDAVQKISKLVNGLTQLSSTPFTSNEKCDLHTIIENCLAILSYHLKGRIKIIKNYTEENLTVTGNPGQLHQALISIMINAAQAINGEGSIEIESQSENDKIYLTISDTGCGIEEQNLAHVTDPFFTTKGSGSGLGLSISYTILKNHGGDLHISSVKNSGTSVRITLPQTILQ
jgi:C4-dicarboxylate-specific signal transduction histidine kinase